MSAPRPSILRFTRAIVRTELARGNGEDTDVAQRIVTRLHRELGKLLGPAAFDVLVARALVLARRAGPAIAGITVASSGKLVGLDDGADVGAVEQRAVTIVSHLIELLAILIGEDLAMRLLRDVWSDGEEEEEK